MFVEVVTANNITRLIRTDLISEVGLVQFSPEDPITISVTISNNNDITYDFAKFEPEDKELASGVLSSFVEKVQHQDVGVLTLDSILDELIGEKEEEEISSLDVLGNNLLGIKVQVANEKYNFENGTTRLTLNNVLNVLNKLYESLDEEWNQYLELRENSEDC